MSIELYLAASLACDLALLCAVARTLGCFSARRLLLAGALCAAYGALASSRPVPWSTPAAQLCVLCGVSALVYGRVDAGACRVAALLAGAVLIAGGVERAFRFIPPGPARALPCAGTTAALIAMMLTARHPLRDGWQIRVSLRVGDKTVCVPALIDTGNRLREPLSGLPVLIAEAGLLAGALPRSGWRALRFGAVCGSGQMPCFRPNAVWVERGRRKMRLPDVWVAVARQPLPGTARALAPCEFARYAR